MRTDHAAHMPRAHSRHRVAWSTVTAATLFAVLAALHAPVQAQTDAGPAIVEQRLPDGRTVLTDRPVEGAKTVRRWQFEAPDPRHAEQAQADRDRRAEAARERDERLTRLVEQARAAESELALERIRSEQRRQHAQAERERQAEVAAQVVPVWPVHAGAPYWRPAPDWSPRVHVPEPRSPAARLYAPAR